MQICGRRDEHVRAAEIAYFDDGSLAVQYVTRAMSGLLSGLRRILPGIRQCVNSSVRWCERRASFTSFGFALEVRREAKT